MTIRRCALSFPALAVLALAGCNNGPPGAGITNGPPATAESKPALRTDIPAPATSPAPGVADTIPGQPPENGRGGAESADPTPGAGRKSGSDATRATPPAITAPAGGGAEGATRAPDTIQTGTPRSPH
jgi:hypothetical protein